MSVNCVYYQQTQRGSYTLEALIEAAEDVAQYLRDVAHQNNGRFHWINSKVMVWCRLTLTLSGEDLKIPKNSQKSSNYFGNLR